MESQKETGKNYERKSAPAEITLVWIKWDVCTSFPMPGPTHEAEPVDMDSVQDEVQFLLHCHDFFACSLRGLP